MKVAPLQGNFNTGEVSPLLYGRVDAERYKSALAKCLNYFPTSQGGLLRRSGTKFVAEVKNSAKSTRLQAFEFSTTQAYMLEFGDLYIRFFRDNGQIESSPGVPYEIVSTYAEANLFQLKFAQSADTLYIVHPSYAPRKLTRTGHTAWTLSVIDFLDGPYLAQNATAVTMVAGAGTGATTITASVATFAATDVGRLVRLKNGANWAWLQITGFTSTTVVNATVRGGTAPTVATALWRLGVWSDTTGYPSTVVFHEDRLFFAGATNQPNRLDGSNTADYENFAPNDLTAGTVTASHAVSYTLNSGDVNAIRWLTSDEKGLLAGSMKREFIVRAASKEEAMTQTNVTAKGATYFGSANVQPVQVGKATLFIQRAGRKLRELTYFYDVDGFQANDLTELSEHITGNSIVQMAYQSEPQQLVYCVRDDGVLASLLYSRDTDKLIVGWARHIVGGVSDAAGSAAKFESVAVIPAPTGTRDEAWVIVKRRINGATKRYVEYLTKFFDDLTDQQDAFFVDCGLTLDSPKTITAITMANPAVVTSAAHGFSNGDKVLLSDILGMTELNDVSVTIAGVAANTFQLTGIDSTGYTPYVSGGEARKMVSSVSGLSHLEGQSVQIYGDGAPMANQTVTAGVVTLASKAAVVHVGLGFNSDGQLLRLEAGAANGTALGKIRRMHRAGLLFHRTLGVKIGMAFENLDEIIFRTTADELSRSIALYSGIKRVELDANYDFENQFCWRQSQPTPGMLLAIMPQMDTQDA
jgi:hypothetical protein